MTSQDAVAQAVSLIDYTIGENVRTLATRRGYNNTTLGAEFGMGASAMSLKIRGRRAWSADDVARVAKLLGVRMSVILGEERMPDPASEATVTDISTRKPKRPVSGP